METAISSTMTSVSRPCGDHIGLVFLLVGNSLQRLAAIPTYQVLDPGPCGQARQQESFLTHKPGCILRHDEDSGPAAWSKPSSLSCGTLVNMLHGPAASALQSVSPAKNLRDHLDETTCCNPSTVAHTCQVGLQGTASQHWQNSLRTSTVRIAKFCTSSSAYGLLYLPSQVFRTWLGPPGKEGSYELLSIFLVSARDIDLI